MNKQRKSDKKIKSRKPKELSIENTKIKVCYEHFESRQRHDIGSKTCHVTNCPLKMSKKLENLK